MHWSSGTPVCHGPDMWWNWICGSSPITDKSVIFNFVQEEIMLHSPNAVAIDAGVKYNTRARLHRRAPAPSGVSGRQPPVGAIGDNTGRRLVS